MDISHIVHQGFEAWVNPDKAKNAVVHIDQLRADESVLNIKAWHSTKDGTLLLSFLPPWYCNNDLDTEGPAARAPRNS